MAENRYSFEQIFCGLRIWWHESFGGAVSIEPATRIDFALKAEGVWQETDIESFYDGLQRFFGFPWAQDDWARYFRLDQAENEEQWEVIARDFTFGALARYVQERVDAVPMAPVTILGRPCLTAGIFRGLEELVLRMDRSVKQFGPSTPIASRLGRSRLDDLSTRLRWISLGRLPAPAQPETPVWAPVFILIVGVVIAMSKFGCSAILVIALICLMLMLLLASRLRTLSSHALPEGIVTFGDLSRFLAEKPTTPA
jgi:hypothetical protein